MIEYPKSLYLHGWDDLDETVIVTTPEEEEAARKDGYKMLSEPADAPKRRRKQAE